MLDGAIMRVALVRSRLIGLVAHGRGDRSVIRRVELTRRIILRAGMAVLVRVLGDRLLRRHVHDSTIGIDSSWVAGLG